MPRFSLRGELRRALLAAGETCWVYAVVLTLATLTGYPRLLSPIALSFTYWIGLQVGRYLPRLALKWRVLQLINIALAVLTILVVLTLDLARDLLLSDPSWPATLFNRLFGGLARLTPEQFALVPLLYMYIRGVGFGQRPLTSWFVGFQFRLGVIVLFLTALLAVVAPPVNLAPLVVLFFVVSLLALSLARIEEGGREMALGGRWALVLAGAVLAVVGLGLLLTPLFTIAAVNILFTLLTPLAPVFEFLIELLFIPLTWIVALALALLQPLLRYLAAALRNLHLDLGPAMNGVQNFKPALPPLDLLIPYVQWLALLAVLAGVALLIARALNRRIMQIEEETFTREPAEPEPARRAQAVRRTSRAGRLPPQEIRAENIRRLYAALLARAAAAGLPRREAETPLEFLPRLTAAFPAAAPDLELLTSAYIAVHYAEIPATGEHVRQARVAWQRVRTQLVVKRS